MRPADILSGASFRTAAYSTICLLLMMSLMGVFVFAYVRDTLLAELQARISEEAIIFREVYQTGGRNGLIAAVSELEKHSVSTPRLTGLFDLSGAKLAGDIPLAPDVIGWQRTTLTLKGRSTTAYVNAVRIDDMTMVVGRQLDLVEATEAALIRVLILSGLMMSIGILAIGIWISRTTLRKLQIIGTTLATVSEGDTSARLPVSADNDQIDRISNQINVHLDRLSSLMRSTQSTATAIAHDLKTPLSHAYLALQKSIVTSTQGDNPEDDIHDALDELSRLNSVFDTILRLSRIQASSDRTAFKNFDATKVLTEVGDALEPVAEEKGQTLIVTPPHDAAIIFGDEKMVMQLLVNLAQNAIQHCPAGTHIALTAERDSDGVTILSVSDDGPGMPESYWERVFEPFVRVDSARSTEGSGLGLALVKAIADRHQARIVMADLEPGLRVSVRFPSTGSFGES